MLLKNSLAYMNADERTELRGILSAFQHEREEFTQEKLHVGQQLSERYAAFLHETFAEQDHQTPAEAAAHYEKRAKLENAYHAAFHESVSVYYDYADKLIMGQQELGTFMQKMQQRYGDLSYAEHFKLRDKCNDPTKNDPFEQSHKLIHEFLDENLQQFVKERHAFEQEAAQGMQQIAAKRAELVAEIKKPATLNIEHMMRREQEVDAIEAKLMTTIENRMGDLEFILAELSDAYVLPLEQLGTNPESMVQKGSRR